MTSEIRTLQSRSQSSFATVQTMRDVSPRHFTVASTTPIATRQGYLSSVAHYMKTLGEEIEHRQAVKPVSHSAPSLERAVSPASGTGSRQGSSPARRGSPHNSSNNVSPIRQRLHNPTDCPTCERRNGRAVSPRTTSPSRERTRALSTDRARTRGVTSHKGEFVAVPTNTSDALFRRFSTPEPSGTVPKTNPVSTRHPLAVIDPPKQQQQRSKTNVTTTDKQTRVQFTAVGQLKESISSSTTRTTKSTVTIPNLNHDGAKQLVAAIVQHSGQRRI